MSPEGHGPLNKRGRPRVVLSDEGSQHWKILAAPIKREGRSVVSARPRRAVVGDGTGAAGPSSKPAERLLRRAAATEETLKEAFFQMGGEMLGFARKSLYASGLAEDAVQETFARAWRSRSSFDPSKGSMRTWLYTIERRVIIDLLDRQRSTHAEQLDEQPDLACVEGLEAAIVGWQVNAALDRLDAEHRQVIEELYFNGRSGRETATLLGLAEGTVRSRAFYALRSLRVLLNEEGWEQ
jgi:RNA polymerase sigma-70 factor (ECF subfamily)